MQKTLTTLAAALLSITALTGCVPVAVGAVGAVAADQIAEERGSDLF
ncbi:MAG: hypothetical protein OXQ92_04955 [Boseongicola sp.]|nr:hypothetical protein [Boseongicola sp.]MDD9977407.1 hypothetical protein [Boseongicola sp.]